LSPGMVRRGAGACPQQACRAGGPLPTGADPLPCPALPPPHHGGIRLLEHAPQGVLLGPQDLREGWDEGTQWAGAWAGRQRMLLPCPTGREAPLALTFSLSPALADSVDLEPSKPRTVGLPRTGAGRQARAAVGWKAGMRQQRHAVQLRSGHVRQPRELPC
jgi:hypothetical protein